MARPVTCSLASLLMLLSLGGCTQNRTHELAPPPGGAQVHFSIKVPPDLAANPMRVMYRSAKCPATRSGADWTTYEEDGRHAIEVQPQRQGSSDLYVADLALDGGGACQWRLSNVTFGVRYANTARFGADVKPGGGGGGNSDFRRQPSTAALNVFAAENRRGFDDPAGFLPLG